MTSKVTQTIENGAIQQHKYNLWLVAGDNNGSILL